MARSKSVLVTGGFGFIGRHLSELLKEDHDVTVLDIAKPAHTDLKFVQADLLNPETVPDFSGFDAVVHLAAVVGVAKAENNPKATLDVNIDGTRNVLEACRKGDVKTVVFPSSSEVYGEPAKIPIAETDFFNPVSAYGVSKIVGEEYVKSFSKVYGTSYSVFRLFSVYGPGQSPDFVVPRFVRQAVDGKPLTVHGDGSQVRAFCYVGDVAEAMKLAIHDPKNDVFNIGNPREPITMRGLAEKVVSVTGSSSRVEFVSEQESGRGRTRDIYNRVPDTGKARAVMGWEAKVGLEEGIKRVAERIRGG